MSDKTITVELPEAIILADEERKTLTLREPKGSDMRGVMMQHVLVMHYETCLKLAARIIIDGISPDEIENMSMLNKTEIFAAVQSFFIPTQALSA